VRRALLGALVLACGAAAAQPAAPTLRLHGSIEKADATSLVVRERDGRLIPLVYAADARITEVVLIDPAAIQSGTFVGTTAIPGLDGSLSAVEVHVFAEAARGTGEGHRTSDLQPGATMTNATVTAITSAANERTMTLHYKDGEKTIRVPNGIPVVTMQSADKSLLVPGAKVIVTGLMQNGQATATRIQVGRNGFTPPM
jgi:outer membrane lipoprotein SlyB